MASLHTITSILFDLFNVFPTLERYYTSWSRIGRRRFWGPIRTTSNAQRRENGERSLQASPEI